MISLALCIVTAFAAGAAYGIGKSHERAFPEWRQRLVDLAMAATFEPNRVACTTASALDPPTLELDAVRP